MVWRKLNFEKNFFDTMQFSIYVCFTLTFDDIFECIKFWMFRLKRRSFLHKNTHLTSKSLIILTWKQKYYIIDLKSNFKSKFVFFPRETKFKQSLEKTDCVFLTKCLRHHLTQRLNRNLDSYKRKRKKGDIQNIRLWSR